MKRLLVAAALLAAVTACSQSSQSSAGSSASSAPAEQASPSAAATNDTGFPLYQDAKIMTNGPVKLTRAGHVVAGREVIAESGASMADLGIWMKTLASTPPAGYTVANMSGVDTARAKAQALGIDFQAFNHTEGGAAHTTLVVAIDPAKFNEKMKPILSLISKYKMLPQALRDPIDSQVKARTGYTVSDALAQNTPIGAAVAAANELSTSGQRAIVLVDGTKQ